MYDIVFAYPITLHKLTSITMFKTVSLWSLQMTVNALLATPRSVVDPVSVQVRASVST
jgi:hypothetical protein